MPYVSNFGDVVGPMIIEGFASCGAMCKYNTSTRRARTGRPRPVLVGLGSVLHHHYSLKGSRNKREFSEQSRKNMTATTHLWGTGEIGFGDSFHYNDADPRAFSQHKAHDDAETCPGSFMSITPNLYGLTLEITLSSWCCCG